MSKFVRRCGKVGIVWAVVSLVVADSAWACKRRGCRARHGAPAYYGSVEAACGQWYQEDVPGIPAAPSPSDVDPPLAPMPSTEPAPPAANAPVILDSAPAATVPAEPVEAPLAGAPPAAAPASRSQPPALSPDDDPFAPALAPTPIVPAAPPKAPAVRPAIPRATPDDDDPFAPAPARPGAPAAKPAADPSADPFKILAQVERPVRDWVDDTGLFRTRGQLVTIFDGKVRILKETGRTTTVPLSRLSTADRQYVESQ